MKKIKAIILDMDGVLVDTEPIHMKSFEIFLDSMHLTYANDLVSSFIGYSIDDNIRVINQTLLKGREIPIKKAVQERDEIYIRLLKEQKLQPISGISHIINYVQSNNLKLALASSSDRCQIDIILESISANSTNGLNYYNLFASIVSGEEVIHRKPAPDIYLKTLKELNLSANECITLEDSAAGLESASQAGILAVGLINPFQDIASCPFADHLVSGPQDILELL